MTSNLVWLESKSSEKYIQFWKENVKEIYQQKRKDVPKYFDWLVDEGIIEMTKENKEQLNEKFYNTAMQTLNICPGFGVLFEFNFPDAEKLDKTGKLKFVLVEKIKEALKVAGLDAGGLCQRNFRNPL